LLRILFVFGTRPEAIKLGPVVRALASRRDEFQPVVCVTGQHRQMLDQILPVFEIKPDYDLDVMRPGQTLFGSTSRILAALESVFAEAKPHMTIVQGDTTSTLAGALGSFYARVPVGHVEAGLRTWDLAQPFPEEMNRVVAGRLATLHFAATDWASDNLRREGVDPSSVTVTGNTGVDALLFVRDALVAGRLKVPPVAGLDPARKLVVVTAHRRESFGEGFERICRALVRLASRNDTQIIYPVHPNPNVQDPVNRLLRGVPNILLIEPMDYVPFVDLMRRATILITDSGGVQEEAPSLGKPVLVLREKTERPEAVAAGTVQLVGTDEERIVGRATELLENEAEVERRSRIYNPYGDGHASDRIVDVIHSFFKKSQRLHSRQ
jgi:UDP-N-acetylglucosamine 2-epimerase (non-hydrolysing)